MTTEDKELAELVEYLYHNRELIEEKDYDDGWHPLYFIHCVEIPRDIMVAYWKYKKRQPSARLSRREALSLLGFEPPTTARLPLLDKTAELRGGHMTETEDDLQMQGQAKEGHGQEA